jgi:hypothetical protein
MKANLKAMMMTVVITILSQVALAHPSDNDSVNYLPNNFRIVFGKSVNIKPNSTATKLDEFCEFTYNTSVDDRVIDSGIVVIFQTAPNTPPSTLIATSRYGLKLTCRSPGSATIGKLRRALTENFGAELVFPAPVVFSGSK